MSEHTPGRLRVLEEDEPYAVDYLLDERKGHVITTVRSCWCNDGTKHANAHRLAAAWNACESIGIEALEAGVIADLLAACEAIRTLLQDNVHIRIQCNDVAANMEFATATELVDKAIATAKAVHP